MRLDTIDRERPGAHEGQRLKRPLAISHPLQRIKRLGSLHGKQRPLVQMLNRDLRGETFVKVGDVVPSGRAVDHHVDAARPAREHQIVENPPSFVEQHRVAHPPELKALHVAREDRFQCFVEPFASDQQLPHMRHIEQPSALPGPLMLGDYAFILDRHAVAGKRHHPCAKGPVQRVERQQVQGIIALGHAQKSVRQSPPGACCTDRLPLSVTEPESFRFAGWRSLPRRWRHKRCVSLSRLPLMHPRGPWA